MNFRMLRQIIASRRKSLIGIALLIGANIALYVCSSSYLEPQVSSLQNKWSEKRRLAAAEGTMDAAAIYRQGTTDLAAWRERIYPKKDFARFIGDLFEAAGNNSLKVGAITYQPKPNKNENLLVYSIGFNVSGKYAAIKSFIADVEKLREMAVIDNVSLNAKSTEEKVDMKLQLTAYFRMEGQ